MQRLSGVVLEQKAGQAHQLELESLCRNLKSELARTKANPEIAELGGARADLLKQKLEEAKSTIAQLKGQLRELAASNNSRRASSIHSQVPDFVVPAESPSLARTVHTQPVPAPNSLCAPPIPRRLKPVA